MTAAKEVAGNGTSGQQVTVTVTAGPPYPPPGGVPSAVLRSAFEEALVYAAASHREQIRKGSGVPYVSHLLGVASLVLEHGGNETAAIAALLHDCIEDCGLEHAPYIRDQFGDSVLAIVDACSDSKVEQGKKRPEWRKRKETYLVHLAVQPAEVLLVSACDKLHNARAVLGDLRSCGQSLWDRFSTGESGQLWYYRRLADTFAARVPDVPRGLSDELNRTVAAIERISDSLRT